MTGEWVLVESGGEMPNDGEEVIVYCRSTGYVGCLEYYHLSLGWTDGFNNDNYWNRFVTHWHRMFPPGATE